MLRARVRPRCGTMLAMIVLAAGCSVGDGGLGRPATTVAPGTATDASMPPAGGEGTPDADQPADSAPARDAALARDAAPMADAAVRADAAAGGPAVPPDAAPDLAPPPPPRPDAAPPPPPPPDAAPAPSSTGTGCSADPALALCLTFDGNADDHSSHHWPVDSAGVSFPDGAADLDGSSEITVGPGAPFGRRIATIEAWVNPRSVAGRAAIVDNNGRWGMFLLGGGGVYCVGAGTARANGVLRVGTWTSVACTFDSDEITLYADGRAVGHTPRGPTADGAARGLVVGSNDGGTLQYDGLIDNVRVWTEVRSPAEICTAARNCRAPAQGP
jgi:hypothetical protein